MTHACAQTLLIKCKATGEKYYKRTVSCVSRISYNVGKSTKESRGSAPAIHSYASEFKIKKTYRTLAVAIRSELLSAQSRLTHNCMIYCTTLFKNNKIHFALFILSLP